MKKIVTAIVVACAMSCAAITFSESGMRSLKRELYRVVNIMGVFKVKSISVEDGKVSVVFTDSTVMSFDRKGLR